MSQEKQEWPAVIGLRGKTHRREKPILWVAGTEPPFSDDLLEAETYLPEDQIAGLVETLEQYAALFGPIGENARSALASFKAGKDS